MAFPFLYVSVLFCAGILFSSLISVRAIYFVPILFITILLAWLFYFFHSILFTNLLIFISIFLCGTILYSEYHTRFIENPIYNIQSSDYKDFEGVLYKSPIRGADKDYLFLKVNQFYSKDRSIKAQGKLKISLYHTPELNRIRHLIAGDKIKISAKLHTSPGFRNFNSPSTLFILKTMNIHSWASSKSPLLVQKIKKKESSFTPYFLAGFRKLLQDKIESYFPGKTPYSISKQGAVLEALLLGTRERIPPSTTKALQKSGLFHLFAISGAHIGIISFLMIIFLKAIRIPMRASYIFLSLFLLFYALLVEGRPSILRAAIMANGFLWSKILWKEINLINSLAFSALVVLFINPHQLFSLGFQLTYIATLSIILFYKKIFPLIPNLPFKTSKLLALSICAQIGVLPLIALSFNTVALSSILLNCIAIPLVGAIMALGYIFLLTTFLSLTFTNILVLMIHFCVNFLEYISSLADGIGFLSFRVPTPQAWVVLSYFFFLLLFLFPLKIRKRKALAGAGVVFFLFIIVLSPFPANSKHFKMTVLDVGQGESILIELPGRKKMLIDGGGLPQSRFDVGERVVSKFLWNKGIKTIDYLVLTHCHPDHMNGLISVLNNFNVKEFWESSIFSQNKASKYFKTQIHKNTLCRQLSPNQKFIISGVTFDVLHPAKEMSSSSYSENNLSLVLKLEHENTTILLTGDIEKEAEYELIQNQKTLHCDVLKAPHHGSITSSTLSFLKTVSPKFVFISTGYNNIYGLPHKTIINRYKQLGIQVLRTDQHGSIELTSTGKKTFIRTAVKTTNISLKKEKHI